MDNIHLTSEQEKQAEQIFQDLQQAYLNAARRTARLFASKPTEQLLGKTEFELRDLLHELGATSVESVLERRKKGGTRGRA